MDKGANNPDWHVYAALHGEADPQTIDRSLARDAALDAVLAEFNGETTPDPELTRKRYRSLCRNRLSKQNNRRALDLRRFRSTHRRGGTDFGSIVLIAQARTVVDEMVYQQMMALIGTLLADEELALLLEIADGHAYTKLARGRNMTVSSLKSKTFRIREKVRNSRIIATLRQGLRR